MCDWPAVEACPWPTPELRPSDWLAARVWSCALQQVHHAKRGRDVRSVCVYYVEGIRRFVSPTAPSLIFPSRDRQFMFRFHANFVRLVGSHYFSLFYRVFFVFAIYSVECFYFIRSTVGFNLSVFCSFTFGDIFIRIHTSCCFIFTNKQTNKQTGRQTHKLKPSYQFLEGGNNKITYIPTSWSRQVRRSVCTCRHGTMLFT